MTELVSGSFCSLDDGRRCPPHLFSMYSLCFTLFLNLTCVLCCSFQSLTNSSTGILVSTMLLAKFIVALSPVAVMKSVNMVLSDSNLQLGFICFSLMNLTNLFIMSTFSWVFVDGFSACETSVTALMIVSTNSV